MEARGELTRFQPETKSHMVDIRAAENKENIDMRNIVIVGASLIGICLLGAATVMNPGRFAERPVVSTSSTDSDRSDGAAALGIDYLGNGLASANGNGRDWYPPGDAG